jgi:hypothetical protein
MWKWAGGRSNPRMRCFRPLLDRLSYRPIDSNVFPAVGSWSSGHCLHLGRRTNGRRCSRGDMIPESRTGEAGGTIAMPGARR